MNTVKRPGAKRPADKEFSEQLRQRRRAIGLTVAETARYLGLSVRGYNKYEQAESAPPAVMREGIFARLDRLQHAAKGLAKKGKPLEFEPCA